MRVETKYKEIITAEHTFVTENDAHALTRAATRDNESAGGCCAGPGTGGTVWLRDTFTREPERFRDLNARAIITGFLQIDSQGNPLTMPTK